MTNKTLKFFLGCYITMHFGCSPLNIKGTYLQDSWPIKPSGRQIPVRSYYLSPVVCGFILLKNGDTLSGTIKLVNYYAFFPSPNFIEFLPKGKKSKDDVIRVLRYTINSINVFIDTFYNSNGFVTYFNINNKEICWQLYAKKYNAFIYNGDIDYSLSANPTSFDFKLCTQKGIFDIGRSSSFFNNYSHTKSDVFLKFINKHYQQHFKKEDFKDENAMVDYILNKENEKEMLENKK